MNRKKIICLFNTAHDSHCKRRIADFLEAGYSVEVYCHTRNGDAGSKDADYPLHFLANLTSERYSERLQIYRREIGEILRQNRSANCIYYLYGLDLALVFRLMAPLKPYIYEEADLMHLEAGMAGHTWLSRILECLDKHLIRASRLTIMTSEGFLRYHFAGKRPKNICLALNKADRRLKDITIKKRQTDIQHLDIAFIGLMRYDTIYRFAKVIGERFEQHKFHFYGPMTPPFEPLQQYKNILFHGSYTNPDDLPAIYGATDIAIATYDASQANVRYAEPNKLYEAICMQTPLVVSKNTFLAERVREMGIGFEVDASDENQIAAFVGALTTEQLNICRKKLEAIPRSEALADNSILIQRLQALK